LENNNNNLRREGKEEEIINESMNNNADTKKNENIETNIVKKNSEIVDKESDNIISYEKELNNDKERILTKETKEKNIE
jgi:hypothetical protein